MQTGLYFRDLGVGINRPGTSQRHKALQGMSWVACQSGKGFLLAGCGEGM